MNEGVNVYRGDGRRFTAAAVTSTRARRSSTARRRSRGANLAPRARTRDTPVYGLPSFPVAAQAIAKPKIAIWTGLGDNQPVPNPPRHGHGHCTQRRADYCGCASRSQEKIKIPARAAGRPDVDADQRGRAQPTRAGLHRDHHPAAEAPRSPRDNAIGDAPADVRQQRRQLRGYNTNGANAARNVGASRCQHGRCRTRPNDAGADDAGLDVRRHVRRRPTRSPGASTTAAGSTVTDDSAVKPGVRHRHAGQRHARSRRSATTTPDKRVRLRANSSAPGTLDGRARRSWTCRSAPAARPVRVQPVLPLLEGAGRAARAQRGAVPEGRDDRAPIPGGGRVAQSRPGRAPRQGRGQGGRRAREGRAPMPAKALPKLVTARSSAKADRDVRIHGQAPDTKALLKAGRQGRQAEQVDQAE